MIGLRDLAILKDEIVCTGANKEVQGAGDQTEACGDQELSDQADGELGGKPDVVLLFYNFGGKLNESLF